jgi:hypothetical protein
MTTIRAPSDAEIVEHRSEEQIMREEVMSLECPLSLKIQANKAIDAAMELKTMDPRKLPPSPRFAWANAEWATDSISGGWDIPPAEEEGFTPITGAWEPRPTRYPSDLVPAREPRFPGAFIRKELDRSKLEDYQLAADFICYRIGLRAISLQKKAQDGYRRRQRVSATSLDGKPYHGASKLAFETFK